MSEKEKIIFNPIRIVKVKKKNINNIKLSDSEKEYYKQVVNAGGGQKQ